MKNACPFIVAVAVISAYYFMQCNKPSAGATRVRDTLYIVRQLPPQVDTVKAYIRLRGLRDTSYLSDTIYRLDTFFVEKPPFALIGRPFVTRKFDTVSATYMHPQSDFIYNIRYAPDTVAQTTTVENRALGVGYQVGAGVGVTLDGVVRPAIYIGLGFNYPAIK